MADTNWTDALEDLGACGAAVAWARGYESLDAAWAACERGDWMLWLLARVAQQGSPEHRATVATVCAGARRALRFVQPNEIQPAWQALELAERWAQGDPTVSLDDLRRARHAAYAAANAADAANAVYAANAAAAAAAETATATYETDAAVAAYKTVAAIAHAAYVAADAVAAADAVDAERAAIADLIRERHVAPDLNRIVCMQD